MRLTDEQLEEHLRLQTKATGCPCEFCEATRYAALDLRDARALLREALGYVDEYTRLANDFGAEDVLRSGSQHLEGHDG